MHFYGRKAEFVEKGLCDEVQSEKHIGSNTPPSHATCIGGAATEQTQQRVVSASGSTDTIVSTIANATNIPFFYLNIAYCNVCSQKYNMIYRSGRFI